MSRRARPVLTGRALVLGGLVVLLVVLLAAPINRYLGSRHAIGAAAARLHHDRARESALEKQRRQWSDPGFIEQQARARLQFAMPGDTVYVVVDKGQRSDIAKSAGPTTSRDGASWNARLWNSLRASGA